MGVKIREWKGAWWVFINHHGQPQGQADRHGRERPESSAKVVAQQIQARLALGSERFPQRSPAPRSQAYAHIWLEHIKQVRKQTTHADYKKRLDQWILPTLGSLDLRDITRDKIRNLATEQLSRSLSPKTVQNNVRVLGRRAWTSR